MRNVCERSIGGWKLAAALGLTLATLGSNGHGPAGRVMETAAGRHPDAMDFPALADTNDTDDVLGEYPAYLKFILEAGKDVNPKLSARLADKYTRLRKRDPQGAARFLKGLRFEMTQKLEMSGMSTRSFSTRNPAIRRWVAKFLPAWHREADEYWFRSFSNPLVRR